MRQGGDDVGAEIDGPLSGIGLGTGENDQQAHGPEKRSRHDPIQEGGERSGHRGSIECMLPYRSPQDSECRNVNSGNRRSQPHGKGTVTFWISALVTGTIGAPNEGPSWGF